MTHVMEGFITADTAPLTYKLAVDMSAASDAFNALPEEEKSAAELITHLFEQNRALLHGLARLELVVNSHAGETFTGRPLGNVTVDN